MSNSAERRKLLEYMQVAVPQDKAAMQDVIVSQLSNEAWRELQTIASRTHLHKVFFVVTNDDCPIFSCFFKKWAELPQFLCISVLAYLAANDICDSFGRVAKIWRNKMNTTTWLTFAMPQRFESVFGLKPVALSLMGLMNTHRLASVTCLRVVWDEFSMEHWASVLPHMTRLRECHMALKHEFKSHTLNVPETLSQMKFLHTLEIDARPYGSWLKFFDREWQGPLRSLSVVAQGTMKVQKKVGKVIAQRIPRLTHLKWQLDESSVDLTFLAGMTRLTSLDLSDNSHIENLSPLRSLRRLQRLNLWHSGLSPSQLYHVDDLPLSHLSIGDHFTPAQLRILDRQIERLRSFNPSLQVRRDVPIVLSN